MSKRYGRNQKRRHRELIADLRSKVESLTRDCNQYESDLKLERSRLRSLIDDVERVTGTGGSCLVPPNWTAVRDDISSIEMVCQDHSLLPNYETVRLRLMRLDVEKDGLRMRRMLHLASWRGHEFLYWISEECFKEFRKSGVPTFVRESIMKLIIQALERA
jgi:hypothetical protein